MAVYHLGLRLLPIRIPLVFCRLTRAEGAIVQPVQTTMVDINTSTQSNTRRSDRGMCWARTAWFLRYLLNEWFKDMERNSPSTRSLWHPCKDDAISCNKKESVGPWKGRRQLQCLTILTVPDLVGDQRT
ncbi:hypothetical protein BKA70DRAFT_1256596 [Coprinopsis sp. MPI-PUGE-AT-0042]|nr:hypothetical protein BKA70DRAFT_1256596 [Coprinopsis sp. MPI-PUGE-AT-0042]